MIVKSCATLNLKWFTFLLCSDVDSIFSGYSIYRTLHVSPEQELDNQTVLLGDESSIDSTVTTPTLVVCQYTSIAYKPIAALPHARR